MAKKGKVLQTIIDIAGEISPTLGQSINGVADKLDSLNVKTVAFGAAAASAAGLAVAGISKATSYLKDLGSEYDAASNSMAASTGRVGKELEDLEEVMRAVYANQYGETMQEAADGVEEVYRQTKLTGDALQETTEGAFALQETFEYDIAESARAAKAMMDNFAVSGKDAMGMIAAGAQNGLDYSGELLDSISEYSVQFAKLGFTADDMFQIFQQGADSGAWNLDKVGDAVKEFTIRSIDGSKGTVEAFEALNLNAEVMMETLASGGDDAQYAFRVALERLMEMDDHVKRDATGVALFGTMWEDLSADVIGSMLNVQGGVYDTADALGKINAVKYDSIDAAMEGIKRNAEMQLVPAAQSVTDAFIEIAPRIEEMTNRAAPYIVQLADKVGPFLSTALDLTVGSFEFLYDTVTFCADSFEKLCGWASKNKTALGYVAIAAGTLTTAIVAYNIAQGVANAGGIAAIASNAALTVGYYALVAAETVATAATTAWGAAVAFLTSPITLVILAIGALVAAGVLLYKNWDTVKEKALEVGGWLSGVWLNVSDSVSGFIDCIGEKFPIFAGYLSGLWSSVSAVAENIKGVFNGIIGFIDGVFSGNWSAAWDSIVSVFANLFGGLVNIAKTPINGVVGAINAVIDGINGVGFTIPDWVPVVGGKSYSLNISKLPMFAAGGHTDGISIAGEAGMETVISYDPAYRRENLSYWAEAGRMLGADWSDFTFGGSSGSENHYDFSGITFAPNITVQGNASKSDIIEAIRDTYPEFVDLIEEIIDGRGDPVYA